MIRKVVSCEDIVQEHALVDAIQGLPRCVTTHLHFTNDANYQASDDHAQSGLRTCT